MRVGIIFFRSASKEIGTCVYVLTNNRGSKIVCKKLRRMNKKRGKLWAHDKMTDKCSK